MHVKAITYTYITQYRVNYQLLISNSKKREGCMGPIKKASIKIQLHLSAPTLRLVQLQSGD